MAGPKQPTPPKNHKPDGRDPSSLESGNPQHPWGETVRYARISFVCIPCAVGILAGRIHQESGSPIPSAKIDSPGLPGMIDSVGRFEFIVAGDRLRPQLEIERAASGYEPAHYMVVPNSEHVVLSLRKMH